MGSEGTQQHHRWGKDAAALKTDPPSSQVNVLVHYSSDLAVRSERDPPPPNPTQRSGPDTLGRAHGACVSSSPLTLISVLASSRGHWHEKRLRNEEVVGGVWGGVR